MFEAMFDGFAWMFSLIFEKPKTDWLGDGTPWLQGFLQAWVLMSFGIFYERIRCWWKCRKLKREIARLQAMTPATAPPP